MDRSRNRLQDGDKVTAIGFVHEGDPRIGPVYEPTGVVKHVYWPSGVTVWFDCGGMYVLPAHQLVHTDRLVNRG